jgi:hypothetical protein
VLRFEDNLWPVLNRHIAGECSPPCKIWCAKGVGEAQSIRQEVSSHCHHKYHKSGVSFLFVATVDGDAP